MSAQLALNPAPTVGAPAPFGDAPALLLPEAAAALEMSSAVQGLLEELAAGPTTPASLRPPSPLASATAALASYLADIKDRAARTAASLPALADQLARLEVHQAGTTGIGTTWGRWQERALCTLCAARCRMHPDLLTLHAACCCRLGPRLSGILDPRAPVRVAAWRRLKPAQARLAQAGSG